MEPPPLPAAPIPTPTTLVEAAEYANTTVTKSLLERRTNRKTLNEALFAAAGSAPLNVDLTGKYVAQTEANGIHYATVARILIEHGAQIEARDEYGTTTSWRPLAAVSPM
jgi:hypothetical protein